MSNMTFLTEDQVFGDNKLEILKKYGTKAAITDFSILLGGGVSSDKYTSEGNSLATRVGFWCTKSSGLYGLVRVVTGSGKANLADVCIRSYGARPSLPYSSIQLISSNGVRGASGVKEIEYGEYPQTIVDEKYSRELEKAYNNRNLRITGKNYTTDSVYKEEFDWSFKSRIHKEYEYNGVKYIRFVGDRNCNGKVVSDGRIVEEDNAYWVKVEPIIWLVDEQKDIALSKKLIFAGIQFKNSGSYNGDFDTINIKWFMDEHFAKDIDIVFIERLKELKKYLLDSKKMLEKIDILINVAKESEQKIEKHDKTLKKIKKIISDNKI